MANGAWPGDWYLHGIQPASQCECHQANDRHSIGKRDDEQRLVAAGEEGLQRILARLFDAVQEAMTAIATVKEYADDETEGALMETILHLMLLRDSKIPEALRLINAIDRKRLAA